MYNENIKAIAKVNYYHANYCTPLCTINMRKMFFCNLKWVFCIFFVILLIIYSNNLLIITNNVNTMNIAQYQHFNF